MNDAATGPAADAGQEAGGRFSGAFKMAMAGAAVAAGAALMQGLTEAIGQGQITAKLGAQLGATPAEAQKYGKLAGQLFSGAIVTDFQQGADTIRAVMSSGLVPPNATNAQIKSIATNAADLANTFDVDLSEAANAAGGMIKNGLAKNGKEAFDLLTKGMTGIGPASGDLLETFTEYGPVFKSAGISGQTALGLIRQGIAGGWTKDTDKIADAFKEFGIRATEGSKGVTAAFKGLGLDATKTGDDIAAGGARGEKAMALVMDRLRKLGPESQSAKQIVSTLFGGPGEDLGAALFSLDIGKASKAMGGAKGAADALGNGLRDNAGAKLTQFKNGLQQGLVDFLGSKVIPALESFAGWMKDNPNVVKGLAIAITGLLVPALILMTVNAIRAGLTTVTAWVTSGAAAVGSAATQVAAAGRVALSWAMMAGRALIAAGRMAASWLIAMGPIGLVIAAIVALGLLIWANWDKIKTWTAAAWAWVWDKIQAVGKMIMDFFMNWTIVGLVIKHWDTIKTKTAAVWNSVVSWLSALPGRIAAFFIKWSIIGIVLRHWDGIKSGIVSKATGLVEYVRGLPGRLARALGNLNNLLYNKGMDIVRGLWKGIQSMGAWLRSTLMSWAKNLIPGPIADALGIGSPSKLMADEIGRWIPAGITKGIEAHVGDVSASTQLAAATMLPGGPGQATRSAVTPTGNIVVRGDGLNRALLEWLRGAVRIEGQGNVQTALGQAGR
ncbi:phage tail tape measure protein [Streptomyces sp. NPDC002666]